MGKRFKSRKGETITEVLVALLISALAIALLAGMMTASSNMINKSKDKIEKYVGAENTIVERSANSPDTGSVVFKDENSAEIKLSDGADDVTVAYYANGESVRYDVRSYKQVQP